MAMTSAADTDPPLDSQLLPVRSDPPVLPEEELANLQLTPERPKPSTRRTNRRLSGIQPCSQHRMRLRSRGPVQVSPLQLSLSALRLDSSTPSPVSLIPFDQLKSPVSSAASGSSAASLLGAGAETSDAGSDGDVLKDVSESVGEAAAEAAGPVRRRRRSLAQLNPEPSRTASAAKARRGLVDDRRKAGMVGGEGGKENSSNEPAVILKVRKPARKKPQCVSARKRRQHSTAVPAPCFQEAVCAGAGDAAVEAATPVESVSAAPDVGFEPNAKEFVHTSRGQEKSVGVIASHPTPGRITRRRASGIFSPLSAAVDVDTDLNAPGEPVVAPLYSSSSEASVLDEAAAAQPTRKSRRRSAGIFASRTADDSDFKSPDIHVAPTSAGSILEAVPDKHSVNSAKEQPPSVRKSRRRSDVLSAAAVSTGAECSASDISAAPPYVATHDAPAAASTEVETTVRRTRRRSASIFKPSDVSVSAEIDAVPSGPSGCVETPVPTAPEELPAVRRPRRRASGRFAPLEPSHPAAAPSAASAQSSPQMSQAHADHVTTEPVTDVTAVNQLYLSASEEHTVPVPVAAPAATAPLPPPAEKDSVFSSALLDFYLNKEYSPPPLRGLETIMEEESDPRSSKRRPARRCAPRGQVRRCEFELTEAKQRLRKLKATRVKSLNKALHRRGKTQQAKKLLDARLRELDLVYRKCDEEEMREATRETLSKVQKRAKKSRVASTKKPDGAAVERDDSQCTATLTVPVSADHMEVDVAPAHPDEPRQGPREEVVPSLSPSLLPAQCADVRSKPPLSLATGSSLSPEVSRDVALTQVGGHCSEPSDVLPVSSPMTSSLTVSFPVCATPQASGQRAVVAGCSPATPGSVSTPPTGDSHRRASCDTAGSSADDQPATSWEDAAFAFATPQSLSTRAEDLHFPTPRLERSPSPEPMSVSMAAVATPVAEANTPRSAAVGGDVAPPVVTPYYNVSTADLSRELMFSTPPQRQDGGAAGSIASEELLGLSSCSGPALSFELTETSMESIESLGATKDPSSAEASGSTHPQGSTSKLLGGRHEGTSAVTGEGVTSPPDSVGGKSAGNLPEAPEPDLDEAVLFSPTGEAQVLWD